MYNGQIIKQLLAEKNIQNKELLNYLGTEANSSLSQIVNGNPTVRRLEKVADFFGVSMDVFFNREKPYQTFSTNDLSNLQLFKDKIELLETCVNSNIPVISSMGAGNRIDPTKLYISDISEIENKNAPFVSNIIYQLKKRGIEKGITVVASREKPFVQKKISAAEKIMTKLGENIEFTKIIPSSTPFVASCAGIFMASYIVQSFLKEYKS